MAQETRSSFAHGSKSSIGATAVALSSAAITAFKGVLIKAAPNNSGIVYVGNSDAVTADGADGTTGFPLAAGESLFVEKEAAGSVYLIGSATGQKVFFIAL